MKVCAFALTLLFVFSLMVSVSAEEMTIFAYQCEVAYYQAGDMLGLIDNQQQKITEPLFSEATPFYDNIAVVANEKGLWGIIDKKGNYVFEPLSETVITFFGEYASVTLEGRMRTIIDKQGNMLFRAKTPYDYEWITTPQEGYYVAYNNGRMWYEDLSGDIAFDGESWIEAGLFSEGLAPVFKDDKWGYINTDGDVAIDYQFYEASSFHNGLASVWVKGDKHYSYINQKGDIVLSGPWEEALSFGEYGYAPVMIDGLWGYINMQGEIVIQPQWEEATKFNSGLAAVSDGDSFGYIDNNGQYAIKPKWRRSSVFASGYAFVFQHGGGTGYINMDGKLICWNAK